MALMHPALALLIKLHFVGYLRRLYRRARTVRGALSLLVGLAAVSIWLLSLLSVAVLAAQGEDASIRPWRWAINIDPRLLRMLFSGLLYLWCLAALLPLAPSRISFSLAEIGILYPSPFSRKSLLTYKLAFWALWTLPTSLFLSMFTLILPMSWLAAAIGLYLSFMFMCLFTVAVELTGKIVDTRFFAGVRMIPGVMLLFGLLLVVANLAPRIPVYGWQEWQEYLLGSRLLYWLLLPFDPFARATFTSSIFPDLLVWGSVLLCVDLALYALIMRLDVDFSEAALTASQRKYEQLRRLRETGAFAPAWKVKASRSLPDLPRMWGAGPLIWRHVVQLIRRGLGVALIGAAILLVLFGIYRFAVDEDIEFLWMIAGMGSVYALGVPLALRLDFRGDLGYMDRLKALPLSPSAVVAGELILAALVVSAVQLGLFAVTAYLTGAWLALLVAALFCPAVTMLVLSADNAMVLLLPPISVVQVRADLDQIGRGCLTMLLRAALLVLCVGAAQMWGGLAYWIVGGWPAFLVATWIAMVLQVIAILPIVGWAFNRFDPSADMARVEGPKLST